MEEEIKKHKKRTVLKVVGFIMAFIILMWFCLVSYEYYRVSIDQRPLICFNEKRESENDKEYSLKCTGILYKYKEYYTIEKDAMTARELTMIFTDFERNTDK